MFDADDALMIGTCARMIRRRRGLSLEVVAGLAGITAPYLSMLERGQRGFNRRGLIEDLADALACSVADLTGQPHPAPDRATAEGRTALLGITDSGKRSTLLVINEIEGSWSSHGPGAPG